MHRAGDWLTILEGPNQGRTLQVSRVRMFATDAGYYLHGGGGLYRPRMVELARERDGGNPCGQPCNDRHHELIDTCDHCRGTCDDEWGLACQERRRAKE